MRPYLVVIFHVRQQYMTEVSLAEHNNVVNALPPDRTDQPFGISVLPWGARRCRPVANADIGPLELPIVREAVTGAMMPAITLPTNGLRLFRLESTCLNEPLPHDRQKAVGFSHISVAFF